MSALTPLLAASGETPTETYLVQVNRGYNSTSTSSEVEVLTIAKIAEDDTPVWEIVSQIPIGHFLGQEGYAASGGAITSLAAAGRQNFYIGGLYPGYSEGAAPILDELGDVNYLSGLDLLLLNSYDGDSLHLVDITDPANPTIPVRSDGTHPSKYYSSSFLNNNYTSTFLHESTTLPNGDPNPYGPKIITREGATGGDYMGHISYLESSVPFTYSYELNTAFNQPIVYNQPEGLWVNGDHPIVHTSSYASPYTFSAWYPLVSEIAGSSVHGTPGYDISSFNGSYRAEETAIGSGVRSLGVLYYEDTGYTDSNGNPVHICMHINASNLIYHFFVPATGITDGTDWVNTFTAVNGHDPISWNNACWETHPALTSAGLPGDTGSVGATIDVMDIRLDPNIRVHADSLGTAVVSFYYANNFPATSQREHWVMTLDIRAPSNNLANTVGSYNIPSVIYDVIDCINITDYLWGQSTIGGVYTGSQSTTNYMNRPFYDTKSRILAVGGNVSSSVYFPVITAQTSRPSSLHSPMLAFFKIADNGTISHHNSPVGNGWAIEYFDNQLTTGYTIPSAQQLNYTRGNNGFSMRVYQRPKS